MNERTQVSASVDERIDEYLAGIAEGESAGWEEYAKGFASSVIMKALVFYSTFIVPFTMVCWATL